MHDSGHFAGYFDFGHIITFFFSQRQLKKMCCKIYYEKLNLYKSDDKCVYDIFGIVHKKKMKLLHHTCHHCFRSKKMLVICT